MRETARNILTSETPLLMNMRYHTRPISELQFNRDGDLLFTAAKDSLACAIRLEGEILGIFRGHKGAVMTLDVKKDSSYLATGGADKQVLVWDVMTGKCTGNFQLDSIVRTVQCQKQSDCVLFCNDDSLGGVPCLGLIDIRSGAKSLDIPLKFSATRAVSNFSDQIVVVSDADGNLYKLDMRNTEQFQAEAKIHTSKINHIRNSFCDSFFVTSSSDAQSKIVSYDLEEMRCFVSEDPINSAAIFRTNDKIITAGGINARDVTVTRSKNIVVNIYDIITSENLGNYSTHFGTINAVDIHPSCSVYASGGEEGIVCIVGMGSDMEGMGYEDQPAGIQVQ